MEEIFKREGVPPELTRIPFVESSFNLKARSKVGASGIWQFMRSTGKLYLKINSAIDERNDPIRATEAAAKLLKLNYESLSSWPLAVVAYNHGRMGMMRAVRKTGSNEFSDVLAGYKSRTFGFASQNFYLEFLAALHVERNFEKYFGKIKRDEPVQYVPVLVKASQYFSSLIQVLGFSKDVFKELNPAFTHSVYGGRARIPANYAIRLPADWGKDKGGADKAFEEACKQIVRPLAKAAKRPKKT